MIGLYGSAFFVGFALTGVVLKQSDIFGRKKILQFGLFVQILCCYGLYFLNNQYLDYVLLFVSGLIISKNYVCYILITELVPKRLQMIMGCICLTCDTFFPVMTNSIYFMAGGKDWKQINIVPLVVTVVAFALSFLLIESPRYLYARQKFRELRQNIDRIARINKAGVNVADVSFGRPAVGRLVA